MGKHKRVTMTKTVSFISDGLIEGENALLEIKTLPSLNKLTAIDSFEKAISEKKVSTPT